MRYSKSMIEAVKQVAMYEQFDYVLLDRDNRIIARFKGKDAKKQAELNKKSARVKQPAKVYPIRPTDKKKVGDTVIGIGELTDKQRGEIEEDVKNALAGFDNRIRDAASMDRKDFIKAKELYKRKDVKGLRKHIYSLDTSPLEVVMNLISIQDRPFFDKMYPNTRGGEFLAKIAYQHRHLDEKLDENKDDEKKRMKGAKLRLKMGEGFASDAQRRAAFAQGYKAKGKKDKKEETLDEAVADLFVKKGDVNQIAVKIAKSAKGLGLKSGVMGNQVRVKGSQKNVNDFMRAVIGKSSLGGPSEVGASNPQIDKMLNKQLKEETLNEKKQAGYIAMYGDKKVEIPLNKAKDLYQAKQIAIKMMNVPKSKQGLLSINPAYEETIKEDGHTDVSSAVRQCKTITEDAMQIMGKLKSMSGEDSLPTWWTNKLAVASNSMNKMRDYILVPSDGMNEQLQEAMGDLEDMKKVVKELENASKMHLAQSKRVAAHIGAMEKKEDIDERMKLPRQLIDKNKEVMIVKKNKVIVIDKKDKDKYMRQGWELAEKVDITSKELLNNKFKEEKNGAQHFSKVNEDNYVWNFVYDDFGRTKLTTEPDKATHLVYTMEGKDNPQLLKLSEREILDYKKGENK